MMSIYDKIDTIFSGESEDRPVWVGEILDEIKKLNGLLKVQQNIDKVDKNYYEFVKEFRKSMKIDVANNIYPTFYYNGKTFGINSKGLLYNKSTKKVIPKNEAFKTYKYAYENRENLCIA